MGTTLAEIKARGWEALVKELGYAGATKFILPCEPGGRELCREKKRIAKRSYYRRNNKGD